MKKIKRDRLEISFFLSFTTTHHYSLRYILQGLMSCALFPNSYWLHRVCPGNCCVIWSDLWDYRSSEHNVRKARWNRLVPQNVGMWPVNTCYPLLIVWSYTTPLSNLVYFHIISNRNETIRMMCRGRHTLARCPACLEQKGY